MSLQHKDVVRINGVGVVRKGGGMGRRRQHSDELLSSGSGFRIKDSKYILHAVKNMKFSFLVYNQNNNIYMKPTVDEILTNIIIIIIKYNTFISSSEVKKSDFYRTQTTKIKVKKLPQRKKRKLTS